MTSFSLLLSDAVLARVLAEALRPLGTVALCATAAELEASDADAWLVDVAQLASLQADKPDRLLFVVGSVPEATAAVTESFALPLRLGHMVARVKLHMTTSQQKRDREIILGALRFYPYRRSIVRADATSLSLTEKEAALLAYLADAGRPVGRDELLAEIWGYDPRVDTHTLQTHISRLRTQPDLHDLIQTVQGGYLLVTGETSA